MKLERQAEAGREIEGEGRLAGRDGQERGYQVDVISTPLPQGWFWVTDANERRGFERELAREMPASHVLAGRAARLIARHERRDDFLFRLDGDEVANVHLTWSVERDDYLPWTEIHPSLEVWAKTGGVMR